MTARAVVRMTIAARHGGRRGPSSRGIDDRARSRGGDEQGRSCCGQDEAGRAAVKNEAGLAAVKNEADRAAVKNEAGRAPVIKEPRRAAVTTEPGRAFQKALWVVRDRITTRAECDDLLADAVTRGIRDLVVQVRGRGDAYYSSSREPRAEGLEEGLDPLAHLVRAGAFVGVRVHAWGNVFYVWSDRDHRLPSSPSHVARAHPDWLLRPDGEHVLDPAGGADWEGVYVDPRSAPGREHTLAVFSEIVSGYAVEGFHYDFVRYPQTRYAASADDHEAVTSLVRAGARRLRAIRSGLVLSAAVFPDPAVARDAVLQRWPQWAAEGLIDLLCPMAYRRQTSEVARILGAARAAAAATRMWGGLMGYAGETRLLTEQVREASNAGCEGAILFSYDPRQPDLLDAFAAA